MRLLLIFNKIIYIIILIKFHSKFNYYYKQKQCVTEGTINCECLLQKLILPESAFLIIVNFIAISLVFDKNAIIPTSYYQQ